MRPLYRRAFFGGLFSFTGVAHARLGRAATTDTYTMRCNVPTALSSLLGRVASQFAAGVNRRSNGRLVIEVYPSGQLAKEQASIDALVSGVLDLTLQGPEYLQAVAPQFAIFDMPFLFKSFDSVFRFLDGPIGTELVAELQPKGIVGLAWGCTGFIDIETTSKPIVYLEDVKGLRIRTRPSAFSIATYQAMGAIPVSIDFAETFTALQQHTIDGLDATLDAFATESKLYTVCKYVAMSNHFAACGMMSGSKQKIDALPAELQRILRDEAGAAARYWRLLATQRLASDIQTLRQNGVTITEIQYPDFRRAMQPVYAEFQQKFGSALLSRVLAAAGA